MRIGIGMKAMALGLAATMAAAQSPRRLIVVVGQPDDPRVTQQRAALEHDAAALRERDLVVQDITPEAARRERPELGVGSQAAFEVLLVGKCRASTSPEPLQQLAQWPRASGIFGHDSDGHDAVSRAGLRATGVTLQHRDVFQLGQSAGRVSSRADAIEHA